MSSITLSSNVASLNAQRRFDQSTNRLRDSFTRLSPGLRINRASDDASGLAISSGLSVDARVTEQGIRNFSDGLSALNIAEGAASELSNILIRLRELSTQASNGSLGSSQRAALDQEAHALISEYNRIAESTDFNDLLLFDRQNDGLRLQGGYGANGSLSLSLRAGVGELTGNQTFASERSAATGFAGFDTTVATGDINGDGRADVITNEYNTTNARVFLGNGDGTFSRGQLLVGPSDDSPANVLADFNNDGSLDYLTTSDLSGEYALFRGNGNGTFRAGALVVTNIGGEAAGRKISAADFNRDGNLDFVINDPGGDLGIFFGNGDGSFRARTSMNALSPYSVLAVDVNGDNIEDLASGGFDAGGQQNLQIFLGNTNGTFRAPMSFSSILESAQYLVTGDFNGDNQMDLALSNLYQNFVTTLLGNGDGSFRAAVSIALSGPGYALGALDVNGDGRDDILTSGSSRLLLSNGDGTFAHSNASAISGIELSLADINGDGVKDLVGRNGGDIVTRLSNTKQSVIEARVQKIYGIHLSTLGGAKEAQAQLDGHLESLSAVRASIGALQSRIAAASNNLRISRELYDAARSQITDLDTAVEMSALVRQRILQQASAAVLAQANQSPSLALELL